MRKMLTIISNVLRGSASRNVSILSLWIISHMIN